MAQNPQNEEIATRIVNIVNAHRSPTTNSAALLSDVSLWTEIVAAIKGEGGDEEPKSKATKAEEKTAEKAGDTEGDVKSAKKGK